MVEADTVTKTRQKLKEAYDAEFLATIERAEKQIILARHGRRLIQLLDDSPVVPGDQPPAYHYGTQARQILNDAEDDLRDWQLDPSDFLNTSRPPVQLHSPALSSPSEGQQTPPREHATTSDSNKASEKSRSAQPQGEYEPVRERGSKGDDVGGMHGEEDENRIRTKVTEASLSQSSQQLEGSTVLTGSPVSSADGWRVHANLFSPQHPSVAY